MSSYAAVQEGVQTTATLLAHEEKTSEGGAKNENDWIEVKKTRKTNKVASKEVSSVQCSNEFEALKDATISLPCQEESDNDENNELKLEKEEKEEPTKRKKDKKTRRLEKRMKRLQLSADEEAFFTNCIERAEDERTEAAKQDDDSIWRRAEEEHAQQPKVKPSIQSTGREVSYRARNFIRGIVNNAIGKDRHVRIVLKHNTEQYFHNEDELKKGKWRDGSAKRVLKHREKVGAIKPTTIGKKSKQPKQKGMASTNANRREQTIKKKKKARRKKNKMLRPDEDPPAEKVAGRRHCSKKITKKTMTKKEERQAKAAAAQRKPPDWKQRLLSFLYDSGADGHYPTEAMRKEAGLSIKGTSDK